LELNATKKRGNQFCLRYRILAPLTAAPKKKKKNQPPAETRPLQKSKKKKYEKKLKVL
jgi:hypothetical protein